MGGWGRQGYAYDNTKCSPGTCPLVAGRMRGMLNACLRTR